ncbi:hypothetical protein J2Z40_003034 [Cytobacillus eiseniae]|uniref:Aspartyl-phosphate phosphatase Spo0E family protein n=1 Tax=Cytobacillus eiseniae TaxID=762947 RepID=A0ABS4RJD0_9BACI|nr:aspartyl-phosphate phosphatase Spo0E family protein [Cytobacillus eiseniae]MBP2242460.1 hypothetical protein [Cytobacillus eiseniae]
MNKTTLEQLVLRRINKMRREMIQTAHRTGIDSIETLHCSQKLDKLIYLHLVHFS